MNNSNWYNSESWYAPLEHKQYAQPAIKRKKKGKGWLVFGIVIAVLALIIASSYFVREFMDDPMLIKFGNFVIKGELPNSSPDADTEEKDDSGMPSDWKEYLDKYYSGKITENVGSDIEKIEADKDMKLYVYSNDDLESKSNQALYDDCLPFVVAIKTYKENTEGYGWATGVVISENGYIVTNAHVVSGYSSATVCLFDNREFEAKLIGSDAISDIALIKIEADDLEAAQLGDSSELNEGDAVIAIGNPLGETFRFTMTNGIVSAIDRDISYNGHTMTLIQTNAAINEGNSGGPLLNEYGQVIGIVNMKMMSSYSSIEGIGFAIPSNTACMVVNELIQNGVVTGRVSLGITVGTIPQTYADHYNLPQGLYVSSVVEGTDSAEKGITKGDIITHVNGTQVMETTDILEIIKELKVGDTVTITVWRDGESIDFEVALMDTNNVY